MSCGIAKVDKALVSHEWLQSLDGVALHARSHTLANHPIQVDEDPEPEEVIHLVLVRGKTPHQPTHRLLSRLVHGRELVDRCRLVMVVVVDVQPSIPFAANRDEVDELLKSSLL